MILMKRPSPPSPTAPPIPWIRISHVGDVPPGQSGPIPGLRTARRSRVDRKDTPLSRVYSSYLGPFFSGTVRVTAAVFVMIRAGRVVSHYSLSIALGCDGWKNPAHRTDCPVWLRSVRPAARRHRPTNVCTRSLPKIRLMGRLNFGAARKGISSLFCRFRGAAYALSTHQPKS